ncbi:MAG: hypothetical protein HND48_22600 [Chloroflexi bacterium]|nr:hypothetical protein [Chloroflexota bacterium]
MWRVTQAGDITRFGTVDDAQGMVSPFDIALDDSGAVYVVDRSRADIWRWDADGGSPELWWSLLTAPQSIVQMPGEPVPVFAARPAPTGLAYDPIHNALLVADPDLNTIVRIPLSRGASGAAVRLRSGAGESGVSARLRRDRCAAGRPDRRHGARPEGVGAAAR